MIMEGFVLALHLSGPFPTGGTHADELYGEIYGAGLAIFEGNFCGERGFDGLRGGVEFEGNFRRAAGAGFIANHGAGDDLVPDIGDWSE